MRFEYFKIKGRNKKMSAPITRLNRGLITIYPENWSIKVVRHLVTAPVMHSALIRIPSTSLIRICLSAKYVFRLVTTGTRGRDIVLVRRRKRKRRKWDKENRASFPPPTVCVLILDIVLDMSFHFNRLDML